MLFILPLVLSILFYILKEKEVYLITGSILFLILLLKSIEINIEVLMSILLTVFTLIWIMFNEQKLIGIIFNLSCLFVIFSTSLISLFVGIEILSLSVIILINLYSQDKFSSIIYFFFNGILSALLVLSLGYFYLGSYLGLKFFLLALICKLGLAPFHIILPQLYNNLSPKLILLLDIPYKLTLFFIFYRFSSNSIFFSFFIILSLIVGSVGAIRYKNLISILVYSSLYNNALILITIFLNHADYYLFYIIIYSSFLYLYLSLITLKIIDCTFSNPYYLLIWILLLFNLMGIPPLSGFFIKFFVFYLTLYYQYFFIFFILLISTLIISFIYLRILVSLLLQTKTFIIKNQSSFSSHLLASLISFVSFPLFF